MDDTRGPVPPPRLQQLSRVSLRTPRGRRAMRGLAHEHAQRRCVDYGWRNTRIWKTGAVYTRVYSVYTIQVYIHIIQPVSCTVLRSLLLLVRIYVRYVISVYGRYVHWLT